MAAGKIKTTVKLSGKKEVLHQIEQKLENALADWKENLGEKKFKSRIKKAGKIFSKNLKGMSEKKSIPAKKEKKAAVSKEAVAE